MKWFKEDKGITIIALIVTSITLFTILSVSITAGKEIIGVSKAETVETDMLTIKAKAKEYIEEVDSLNWTSKDNDSNATYGGVSTKEGKNREQLQSNKYKLSLIDDETKYSNYSSWYEDGYTYYEVKQETLEIMGFPSLYEEGKPYIIRYPLEDGDTDSLKIDIIYVNGIKYKGTMYYNLSKLEEVL